jgi:hypothetical protein
MKPSADLGSVLPRGLLAPWARGVRVEAESRQTALRLRLRALLRTFRS